jgi:hypothetical protein
MPHQSKLYKIMHDCEKTLEPDIADLFEREANVFASEVLFQGEAFSQEAHAQSFGIKVPMSLAKKYGASNYATFRRYVISNPNSCCVVILEPPVYAADGSFTAEVRRVVVSKSFKTIFEATVLTSTVTDSHPLYSVIPASGKRMSFDREVVLTDRNCDERICTAEAFYTKHQVLVLIRDTGLSKKCSIVLPASHSLKQVK